MTSVFDVLANEDHEGKVSRRQALSLAHKRVSEKFDGFLRVASNDKAARLDLIQDDFAAVIKTACDEVGYDDSDSIHSTLWAERTASAPVSKEASTHEARRPKFCPYHSEVVDASLAAGDPGAGYAAMAQHAWGDKHCQSDDWDAGRCSFKPQMTTQTYWDDKKVDAEKRREERAEQAQQVEETQNELPVGDEGFAEVEDTQVEEPVAVSEPVAESDNVVDVDFGGEAGEAGLTSDELMAVAASAQRSVPLAIKTADELGGAVGAPAPAPAAAGGGNSGQALIEQRHGLHNGPVALLGFLDASVNGLSARQAGRDIIGQYSPFNREGWEQSKAEPVTVSVAHPEYLATAIAIVERGYEPSNSGPEIKALAQRMHSGEVPFPPGVSPEQVKIGAAHKEAAPLLQRAIDQNPINAPAPAAPTNPAPQAPGANAIHDQFSQMGFGPGTGNQGYNEQAHSQQNYQQVADKMGIGVDDVRSGLDNFYDKSQTAPDAAVAPTNAMAPGIQQPMQGVAPPGGVQPTPLAPNPPANAPAATLPAATSPVAPGGLLDGVLNPADQLRQRVQHVVEKHATGATPPDGDSTVQRKDVEEAHDLKLDKRQWTPENLEQRLDTEVEGSPHPTVQQDVVHDLNDPSRPDNEGDLDQIGEHLTEHQDLAKDTGPQPNKSNTW